MFSDAGEIRAFTESICLNIVPEFPRISREVAVITNMAMNKTVNLALV